VAETYRSTFANRPDDGLPIRRTSQDMSDAKKISVVERFPVSSADQSYRDRRTSQDLYDSGVIPAIDPVSTSSRDEEYRDRPSLEGFGGKTDITSGVTCRRYVTSNENMDNNVIDEDLLPAPDYLPRFDVKITAKPQNVPHLDARDGEYYRCDSENVYTDSSVRSERRNYEDYLVTPRNRRGWTTVTETTTITYARSVSIERSVRGRRQRYFENVEVHEYGKPASSPYNAVYSQSTYSRNGSSRSRSQGPSQRMDRWQQTDDWDTEYIHPSHHHNSHRSSSAVRSDERNYRSYASKLYDRQLLVDQRYPEYRIPPIDYSYTTNSTPVRRPEYHTAVNEHNIMSQSMSHETSHKSRRHREVGLQYQHSNLEEIPVTQLLDDFPSIEHDNNQNGHIDVVPLETRLLQPGVHTRNRPNAPLRRAQHRIRNYCVML
jgi:hypothetical protein